MPDEEEDKTQQQVLKVRNMAISSIVSSHKNFVSDIQFIPKGVKVDRKNYAEGKVTHFVSVAEDGIVNIWDTRVMDKEELRKHPEFIWRPFLQIQLYGQDGQDMGLSKLLFHPAQTTTTFYAASVEGELVNIDWSARPAPGAQGDDAQKTAEYIKKTYETERNYRPILSLERSPFYEDIIMTVHDFNFCLWKISLDDYNQPIFRSANTFGSHNTCGAFSPTRPGVIFITKTDGIDVWDFVDQSNKPSMNLNFTASAITYFKFQPVKLTGRKQFMGFGDENDGTLFLYEVPHNLKNPQENEEQAIESFWQREISKCQYVQEQRITRKEEFQEMQKAEELKKALAEQQREMAQDLERQKEEEAEIAYQELLLKTQCEFGMISEEEREK